MNPLAAFTIGLLTALSIAIIVNIPESEPVPAPNYEYAEPSYTTEKIIGGWCAGRIIRRGLTYEATYCAGEFGSVPINIPHTSSPEWDSTFVRMIQEVDSLAGVK